MGVGLSFLEVVVTDLESLQVIPLGVGIDDVLFQLNVGDGAVAVVGVLNITIRPNDKSRCSCGYSGCTISSDNKC